MAPCRCPAAPQLSCGRLLLTRLAACRNAGGWHSGTGNVARGHRTVPCRAESLWLVQSVAAPEKAIGAVLGYGAIGGVLCFGAYAAVRTLIWDYQTRKSDDPGREHDLSSDAGWSLFGPSISGGADNLLNLFLGDFDHEPLLIPDDERRRLGTSSIGRIFLAALVSDARLFTTRSCGLLISTMMGSQSLEPALRLQLLGAALALGVNPPKADWRKPLGPLLLTPDAMEGIAAWKLAQMLSEESQLMLRIVHWATSGGEESAGANQL